MRTLVRHVSDLSSASLYIFSANDVSRTYFDSAWHDMAEVSWPRIFQFDGFETSPALGIRVSLNLVIRPVLVAAPRKGRK